MKPANGFLCLQEPPTGLYPQSDLPSPHFHTLFWGCVTTLLKYVKTKCPERIYLFLSYLCLRSPWSKKVKLSLCLTNQALRHEGVWGSGCIDPHFFDLGTSWRWVVSFTPLPLYPRGKSPPPSTNWIGGWVDPRADLDDVEERKFLTLPWLELQPLGLPARSQSLYRLRYPGSSTFPFSFKNFPSFQF
jgi:hypothetical protein